jgi:8-oxo-dGTP pyrophosphatase MutT (NUDIX family)
MSVPVLPAATVVIVREREGGPALETFLLRRAAGSAFLAGAHVFPGGRVDPEDGAPAWRDRVDGLLALAGRLHDRLDAPAALSHAVAGAREVFEEAGVLLGTCPSPDALVRDPAALGNARLALLGGALSFERWCAGHGVRLAVGEWLPWSHWITPDSEPRRFDTWFFLARVPPGQQASIVPGEASEGGWETPDEALARHRLGEILLAPPTLRTLEEVAAHASWASLQNAARPLTPVLPRVRLDGPRPLLILPGDAEYGDDTPRGVDGPTRFVRTGKRWSSLPA